MPAPRYPSASEIAPKIHERFAGFLSVAEPSRATATATVPSIEDIEAVVDAAFWASLRREENYLPRISVALVPPELATYPLHFDTPLPLGPVALVKVAPAGGRPRLHPGAWAQGGALPLGGARRMVAAPGVRLGRAPPPLLAVPP